MEALQAGCRIIVLDPAVPAYGLLTSRAAAIGATVLPARPPALDLATPAASRRLLEWVTSGPPSAKPP